MRTHFRVDAVARGHGFANILGEKQGDVTIRPLLQDTTCENGEETPCYPNVEPPFMTHPSEVGFYLSMDTPRRDVKPLQEEGRLDHGRSWPVHWPGRCWPRVPSVLHPA